jgi:hypothetical protein
VCVRARARARSLTLPDRGCIAYWRFLPLLTIIVKRKFESCFPAMRYAILTSLTWNTTVRPLKMILKEPARGREYSWPTCNWNARQNATWYGCKDLFRPEQFTNSVDLNNPKCGLHLRYISRAPDDYKLHFFWNSSACARRIFEIGKHSGQEGAWPIVESLVTFSSRLSQK